jgi:hypothetical protein
MGPLSGGSDGGERRRNGGIFVGLVACLQGQFVDGQLYYLLKVPAIKQSQ